MSQTKIELVSESRGLYLLLVFPLGLQVCLDTLLQLFKGQPYLPVQQDVHHEEEQKDREFSEGGGENLRKREVCPSLCDTF